MPSNYPAFDVKIDNDDGTTTFVPLQVVHVYDVDNMVALADVTSNSGGVVPSGSLPVGPGTLVRFYFSKAIAVGDPTVGICGYTEVFTT